MVSTSQKDQDSSMSQSIVEFESKYSKLLTPLKELADNWNIDISAELEDYLQDLTSVTFTFDGSGKKFSFAEAALVIQGSAVVYSKKVEYLYSFIYQTLEHLQSKRKKHNSSIDSQGNDRDTKVKDTIQSDFFEDLEGTLEESDNIDLDDQLSSSSTIAITGAEDQVDNMAQGDYDDDNNNNNNKNNNKNKDRSERRRTLKNQNFDYDHAQLNAYHSIIMNETPSTNSSNSASDNMAKESSVGTSNPNDATTSKSTFMMNKSRVTKDGALSLGVSLGSDLDHFESLGQITDKVATGSKKQKSSDESLENNGIGIAPDIENDFNNNNNIENNSDSFPNDIPNGGDDLTDNLVVDTQIVEESDDDNGDIYGNDDYGGHETSDDPPSDVGEEEKAKNNKRQEKEKEIEKLKSKIKAIANPWLLLDPHEESTDEKPFKRGKAFSLPVHRKGPNLSSSKQSEIQFKSGDLIIFPTETLALRGNFFKDLSYLYQKNINQSRGARLALIHQVERANRKTQDQDQSASTNVTEPSGHHDDTGLVDDYLIDEAEEEYNNNDHGGIDSDSDDGGGGLDIAAGENGYDGDSDLPSYDFSRISTTGEDDFGNRYYDTDYTSSGSPEKSYEEMCKEYIGSYLDSAKQLLQETALMQRLNQWNNKIIPLLEEQSSRPPFDIQSYSTGIVSKASSIFKDKCHMDQEDKLTDATIGEKNKELKQDSLISFKELVGQEYSGYEICRKFASCLQLANSGNLEIISNKTMDNLSFHLLSNTPKHGHEIGDFTDYQDDDDSTKKITKNKESESEKESDSESDYESKPKPKPKKKRQPLKKKD
ncbi:hypothetical protein DFA_02202 [Cavenderia fasciculata]|uniref:Condensin-2 complex subunit H2 n=1 Tax=Cavenderia fasciculata TaxID=261658 RepID=F4PYE8_CACFS|nr:uncharacterized protein DFA_02202 [Cavenderia fasciculata]EGG19415.1 hypothetical protein DFA_02202 [Cavenderia fasciculata]|eukprot:XP_004357686.1 hypothetical protein DFA_02202 [Cavenderia fasciculata]